MMKKVTDYFRYRLLFISLTSLLSFFVPHNLSSNIYDSSFRKHRIERIMPKSKEYLDSLFTYSFECKIEPEEVAALIHHESDWDPYVVSSKKCIGLGQQDPKNKPGIDLYNPYINMRETTLDLAEYRRRFKKQEIAIAAYNAGPTLVDSLLTYNLWDGNPTNFPYRETRTLIGRVTSTLDKIRRIQ